MTLREFANGLFHLDFGKVRFAAGLGYAVSILLVWYLQGLFGGIAYVAGISVVLIWLSDVPGRLSHRLAGIAAFTAASILFSLVTHLLGDTFWPHIVALFCAAFLATAVMVFGLRAYLVGWVFIIWAIVAPLFEMTSDLSSIVAGLATGGMVVMIVATATQLLTSIFRPQEQCDTGPTWRETLAANPDWRFENFGYATVVGLVMVVTSIIGWQSVATDPSWVANAALMVIGSNPRALGYRGVQRALGTVLGIVVGFWLIQVIPGPGMLVAATFLVSFLIVSTMDVNNIFLAFFWTVFMSLEWSLKGQEHVSTASVERIQAELLGIGIAVAAVFLLSALMRRRRDDRQSVIQSIDDQGKT